MKLLCMMTLMVAAMNVAAEGMVVKNLRCERLANPQGIDAPTPRLSWQLESDAREQRQTAYRILVASSAEILAKDAGDLWDSGQVPSNQSREVPYGGKELGARAACFWKVRAWDGDGKESAWSAAASFSIGLLKTDDWQANWISYKDTSPLHTNRKALFLPPARYFRKEFAAASPVKRAVVYCSALGNVELYVNGRPTDDRFLATGWADYAKRAYYVTRDVTALVQSGQNAIGAILTDGWYSGYVGYGLLVGYGPNKVGRYFYGKTPAFIAQLEIEFADGSRQSIVTDGSWKVTDKGPIREADIIMGQAHDARMELGDWHKPGFDDRGWEEAIPAQQNGPTTATFSDNMGDRKVELGFRKPAKMQAYSAPPIRAVQEVKPISVKQHKPGVFIFDLGQEIAGVIRLNVKGPAGTRLQIRYAEMLHPDGRMMTENLRRARATDSYTMSGAATGESWMPRFTYHGFRYVEVSGLTGGPGLEAVTGIVLHNDTPLTGSFECSDATVNRLYQNIVWTQRANFIEVPTDCPQRDERLGWMGDAQIYARTATFNADVQAFFGKWLDDLEEAQRDSGAYPDYAPYPMGHGQKGKTFGTAWMDAGVICPWTMWKVYGDTTVVRRRYDSMARFMEFRVKSDPEKKGVSIGNPWGDWLSLGENTPVEFVDICYFAQSSAMMAEMANAIGKHDDGKKYGKLFDEVCAGFRKQWMNQDGSLKLDTQSAYVLAISSGIMPINHVRSGSDRLAKKIADNGFRMTTGFLGTKPLLGVLSETGHHDLAVRLFQSRKFPSWCYEVENGATTVWERWDSFTKEHGFDGVSGKNNAAMNSFAHYAFGAVGEWMFRNLAGIDTDGPGHQRLILRPMPPSPDSNPDHKPIDWVKASYDSPYGPVRVHWKREREQFDYRVSIPANTSATVYLPATAMEDCSESGAPLRVAKLKGGKVAVSIGSGEYHFTARIKP